MNERYVCVCVYAYVHTCMGVYIYADAHKYMNVDVQVCASRWVYTVFAYIC